MYKLTTLIFHANLMFLNVLDIGLICYIMSAIQSFYHDHTYLKYIEKVPPVELSCKKIAF